MPKELDEKFLHKLTKHTNLYKPHSNHVDSTTFPEQNVDLLNSKVVLKYRDHRIGDRDIISTSSSGRPSDDEEFVPYTEDSPDKFDPHDIYEDEFIIIRADRTEPYRLIAVSTNYDKIVISSSKMENDKYLFEDIVVEYPIQLNEFIGIACYDKYNNKDIPELRSVTLRVDAYEPCYSVLMELLGSTGYVRFILGDECPVVLQDYYDTDGSHDYDNKNASEYSNPVDIDGYTSDHRYISPIKDINGGPANSFEKMYDSIMNDEEIAIFREKTIKGYKIYGAI